MDGLKTDLEIATQLVPAPEGDSLVKALQRLDAAVEQGELPKQLRHYLERRSYVKALAWLENPELPHQA
ncbi:MAG: hypothetical protein GWO81_01660 [Verrucomicrobia bacterium]|nr:hypothetical protein [Verrucomicrobiota bacterium]